MGPGYEEAVPWGRSFEEYRKMFQLSDADLKRSILGVADGPASFNAKVSLRGGRAVSCDPIYALTADEIGSRIEAAFPKVIEKTTENRHLFVWEDIASPEELGCRRREAMEEFLSDFASGKEQGRYVTGGLPCLPFPADAFDLALCSHFLFLYSDTLSLSFHKQAVDELCRVAREVRIFPLLTYRGEPSPFAAPVVEHLRLRGFKVAVETVPYEFQRGGNKMLRIITESS